MCEERARLAAVTTILAEEALESGLSESVVKELWLNEWIRGTNAHVEFELQKVLHGKDFSFTHRSLPTLRRLLDEKASTGNPAHVLHEQRVGAQSADL